MVLNVVDYNIKAQTLLVVTNYSVTNKRINIGCVN